MLRFLKNLFSRQRRADPQPARPAEGTAPGARATPIEYRDHLLVTRRLENPMADLPGFREVYYCTACKDYFVLAWQPKTGYSAVACEVVKSDMLPRLNADLERLSVFCPACRAEYPFYGPVLWPGQPAEKIVLKETFRVTYPDADRGGKIRTEPISLKGVPTERIVVLLAGEVPEALNKHELVCSFLESELGGEIRSACVYEAINVDVLLVEKISDDTALLNQFLQETVYQPLDWGVRMFLTSPPIPLRPPLQQIMLCLVQPRLL
jgi:hypothetical protein